MTEQKSRKMPRRLLAWLLAVCMVCTLLPVTALAGGKGPGGGDEIKPEVVSGDFKIYANGAALIIAQYKNGPDTTAVYVDKNRDGILDDTEESQYRIAADTTNFVDWDIYGGSKNADVEADTQITMTGGKVNGIYGGGWSGSVTGTATIKVTGGEVILLYGDSGLRGTVGGSSVTIGGTAKVGNGNNNGVLINGGGASKGVDCFAIDPDLEEGALVYIHLPNGYDASEPRTIATGAVASDLQYLKLNGDGAEGKMLMLEGSDVKVLNIPTLKGAGTVSAPYLVTSYADLAALAVHVNAGEEQYATAHFKVIDNFPTESGAVTNAIGTESNPFKGSFDGNGQTIRLNIDAPSSYYQGLFGVVGSETVGAAIKNVTVSGSVSGNAWTGGVAGFAQNGDLINCVNFAQITSGSSIIGGVAGELAAGCKVIGCVNTGAVTSPCDSVGGVVGQNKGTVEYSFNTGAVTGSGYSGGSFNLGYAGGIVGNNDCGTVQHCYNTGAITGNEGVGGVVGMKSNGEIQHCLALGMTAETLQRAVGRVVGYNSYGTLTGNQARSDMALIVNGTESTPSSDNDTSLNGKDLPVDGTVTVKETFTGWDDTIWNIPDGPLVVGCELPTLKSAPQVPAPILPGAAVVTTQDGKTTGYARLADALAAAEGNPGSTLQLLDDVQGNYKCEAAAAFTIDLNGKTWTDKDGSSTLEINDEDADITLTDTAGGGRLEVENAKAVSVTAGLFTVSGSKTLTLASNAFSGLDVDASGSVRLINPNAVYTGDAGLWFEGTGTYEITGGTFTGRFSGIRLYGGSQQGVFRVTKALGRNLDGLGIKNTSVTIAGGEYTGRHGIELYEGGTAKLQGGTFTGTNGYAAVNTRYVTPALPVGDLLAEGYGYFQNGKQITDETVLGGQELAENGTVTVGRIQTGTGAYTISGKVTEKNGEAVPGATVTLTQGGETISSATADENGIYRFTGIEPGSFNVTAAHGGKNATVLVTVADADITANITLPAENVSAVVQVKGENTPAITVGGLTEEAEALAEDGKTVTLAMTVEAKPVTDVAGAADILAEAVGKTLEFLEIKLEKQVDGGEPSLVTSTNGLLTIVIPYDLTGKQDVAVYRYHGGSVDTLTTTPNSDDEKIELGANSITLRVKKFSTYAIGYTTGGGHSSSSSGSAARYTITATAGQGGTIAPSGKVSVTRGENKVFAITPNDGYEIADVLVDGKSVGAVKSYTFEKVAAAHTIEARFQQTGGKAAWNPFSDVRGGDWFYDSVRYAYEHDLMNGVSATSFAPHDSTTRGMIVTILWRMAGQPESGETSAFADVRPGSYCDDAVRWAAAQGVVKGYDAQSFGPDDAISREQLAAILYRYAGSPATAGTLDAFADAATASPYAADALRWAAEQGILTGKEGNRLDPKGPATRAEAAAVLMRYIEQK